MHFSKTSVHVSHALFFLSVFAEWTVTQLHIGEIVLVLNKELAAVFAHVDGYVSHEILEVAARILCVEVRVILNIDLLKSK